jgi:hypothetical protein
MVEAGLLERRYAEKNHPGQAYRTVRAPEPESINQRPGWNEESLSENPAVVHLERLVSETTFRLDEGHPAAGSRIRASKYACYTAVCF